MARTDTLPHFLTDIADAIRTAEGSSGAITASAFDTRIEALSGGGGVNINDYFETTIPVGSWGMQGIIKQVPTLNAVDREELNYLFDGCTMLETLPSITNTSGILDCAYLATSCTALENVPYYNLPNCTTFDGAFTDCANLTDTSIQNIMQMCIDCDNENYTTDKVLESIIPVDLVYKAESMPNYQAFISAGWSLYYGE